MFIHYVYRNQRRPEGLCPSSNMEQVSSTGKPIQITVTDGYDLVKLFWEIPSLFILLESTLAFEFRSPCQTSTLVRGRCVGSITERNGVLHHPVSPNLLALHGNGTSFLVFLIDSVESAVHITVCVKYLAI